MYVSPIFTFLTYTMSSALNYKSDCTKAERAVESEFVIATVTGQWIAGDDTVLWPVILTLVFFSVFLKLEILLQQVVQYILSEPAVLSVYPLSQNSPEDS